MWETLGRTLVQNHTSRTIVRRFCHSLFPLSVRPASGPDRLVSDSLSRPPRSCRSWSDLGNHLETDNYPVNQGKVTFAVGDAQTSPRPRVFVEKSADVPGVHGSREGRGVRPVPPSLSFCGGRGPLRHVFLRCESRHYTRDTPRT